MLAQFHLAGMPNGPAFSAIFGAGTDEPVSAPLIQFKRLDDHRIRKAITLNEWFESSDRIYGLAVTLRVSAHQNSGCRDTCGKEKTSPIHGCHGRIIEWEGKAIKAKTSHSGKELQKITRTNKENLTGQAF
ncbi:MAG: hypothetical protein VYC70_02470 [Verrucomicrobiota bacterium]|nr:hypothetical protein [Verrucomicrobiota bacterium]